MRRLPTRRIAGALALAAAVGLPALAPLGAGEPPPSLRLTLAEAVERALAASPTLGQLRALEDAAEADLRGARSGRLPQVDLAAGYTRQSDVPELVLTAPGQPPRTIFPNIPDNYRARLGLAIPLYTGGRLGSLIDAAGHERAAAGRDRESARAELVLETTSAYWSLVTARETERVLGEALGAFEAHLVDARNRQRLGLAAANEVLTVRVERDRGELDRLRAGSDAVVAHANLARLLGLPPAAQVEPAERLETPPARTEDVEALVAQALGARPERAALLARIAAAEARVRAERAGRLPLVTASAGYDYANPNRRILPPEPVWKDSWDVSVNLSLSLFDGGKTSAGVGRAEARAEASRRQLEDLDRRIRLQVMRAHADLDLARAAVLVAEGALQAARENLQVATDRHREGLIPSSERLDAEVVLQRAGLERTEALVQVRVALAALARAGGR